MVSLIGAIPFGLFAGKLQAPINDYKRPVAGRSSNGATSLAETWVRMPILTATANVRFAHAGWIKLGFFTAPRCGPERAPGSGPALARKDRMVRSSRLARVAR